MGRKSNSPSNLFFSLLMCRKRLSFRPICQQPGKWLTFWCLWRKRSWLTGRTPHKAFQSEPSVSMEKPAELKAAIMHDILFGIFKMRGEEGGGL